MAHILDRIVAAKRAEIKALKERRPLAEMERDALRRPPRASFAQALLPRKRGRDIRLIAEIKKASPSKGLIRPDFDPPLLARQYAEGGAAAISVLTDEPFFQGSLNYLEQVSRTVRTPLLRKDFVLEEYQLLEARAAGASAALLIAAILDNEALERLLQEAAELELGTLTEVHTEEELDRAVEAGAPVIGVNNRDLRSFEVDLETTLRLRPRIPPDRIAVSESGISGREDVLRLQEAGVDAILVGESLMRQPDPGQAARALLGSP